MTICGMPIVEDSNLFHREWVFPKERYVEYEPKDESWCRCFGFGKERIVPECYRIGNTWLMHPILADQLRKEIKFPFQIINPPGVVFSTI